MRIYKVKKVYYVSYIMKHMTFSLTNIDSPGFKLRLWHSLLIYNGGMRLIPGVYYFDDSTHLDEMVQVSAIFAENNTTNHTNYLDDERMVRSDSFLIYVTGENNSTRISTPYSYLQRVQDVLCLNLNVQITD